MRLISQVLLLGIFAAACCHAQDVEVWLTRGDQNSLMGQQTGVSIQSGGGTHSTKIAVDPDVTYQSITGFGASITDSSAWLIQNELNGTQRDELMQNLFSPDVGIGMSFVRIPIGASDFALTPYTYDDMPSGQTDPDLNNFSIAHDQSYIIPTLLEAIGIGEDLSFVASPWSPPAWMKNTQSLWGGTLNSQYYDAYAHYLQLFVQAYETAGVSIYAITPQNEPLNATTAMPAATMQTYQQSALIGDYLGPRFTAAGIQTKILVFDHNWADWNYPVVVMNDPEAGQYAAGAAFHGYDGDVAQQSDFHGYHPDAEIHFTEITGGDWATSFADNLMWGIRNIIIGTTRNWSRSTVYWNVALDQNHGPRIGGCSDCRGVVTIHTSNGAVDYEVEYYIIGHASKFVRPGAQRIDSDSISGVIETVAFRNPDGSNVLIAANPQGQSRWFDTQIDDQHFAYRLTGQSVATFIWNTDPGPSLVGDVDGDGDVDLADLAQMLGAYGDCVGDPGYVPAADLDGDNCVALSDLAELLAHYGEVLP